MWFAGSSPVSRTYCRSGHRARLLVHSAVNRFRYRPAMANASTPVVTPPSSRVITTQPLTMFGPDFPFAYDHYLSHKAGLGTIPTMQHGKEIAVIGGGLSGIVTAYELMKLGLRPVVFEAEKLGGRLRTHYFDGCPKHVNAELGAMRFPMASTSLFHYINKVALKTEPFPNPLSAASPSTVLDLEGKTYYGRELEDLPKLFRDIAWAWEHTLQSQASLNVMQTAIRERDIPTIKQLWNQLVWELEGESFYGFLSRSPAFSSFHWREVFGQVGFGTGGWNSDFPSSILEVLRIVYTGADDEQYSIIGGSVQLPERLWHRAANHLVHWPMGTSLASLHPDGKPSGGVVAIHRDQQDRIVTTDTTGRERAFTAAVFTAQLQSLGNNIPCDRTLLPNKVWSAIDQLYFMGSSKLFMPVDRPFWLDLDPDTKRHTLSMTLTDRMLRGVYPLGSDPNSKAMICMSYTWARDSSKWRKLGPLERGELALRLLQDIYPRLNVRRHVIGPAVAISWENEPSFCGAFKISRPGDYRYQYKVFTQFKQDRMPPESRGFLLAGDSVAWTAGYAEGAIHTAVNAISGIIKHMGGSSPSANPGPVDVFEKIAPIDLDEVNVRNVSLRSLSRR